MNPHRDAARVYLLYEGWASFAFGLMTFLSSIYLIVEVQLDPLQLVLVGSVLEGTVLLFEVPTGVLADLVSRKWSVLLGLGLIGAGFVLLGSVPQFWATLAAQVLWGLGYTFTSGADVAWIADEVGDRRATPLYLRAAQWGLFGDLLGSAAAVLLALISLSLPIVIGGVVIAALAVVLAFIMPETGFVRPAREAVRPRTSGVRRTVRNALGMMRARPVLYLILGVAALHGASTEGFDRLSELYLLRGTDFPGPTGADLVLWFGAIGGVGAILSILATEFVKRRVDVTTDRGAAGALRVVNVVLVLAVVGFGSTGSFALALGLYWLIGLLRAVNDPITTAWVNQGLEPSSRATVNSMAGQTDALGQVIGGPVLGAIAVARSVAAALVVSGLLRLPTLLLFRAVPGDPPAPSATSGPPEPAGHP